MNMTVKKRDGSVEDFIPEKIAQVLIAAGLEEDKSLTITTAISDWASSQESPIPSTAIRDEVLKLLDEIDPYIAGLYRWYQKSKDRSF